MRPTTENVNGLLRRYVGKGTDLFGHFGNQRGVTVAIKSQLGFPA